MTSVPACPCGARTPLEEHCGRYLSGEPAPTAEALMRSRYTAYVLLQRGDARAADHLWRTWHPRTRPATVEPSPGLRWTGLEVREVEAGGADDPAGTVRFTARWETGSADTYQQGEVAETSAFVRRGGRWVYEAARPAATGSPDSSGSPV